MLPSRPAGARSLADVLTSCLAAVRGEVSPLGLPAVDKAIVVLVDGLGATALKTRAGHARALATRLTKSTTIESGFPTTTASALASLTTGALPGAHGLVGYQSRDPGTGRVFNHLSGWVGDPAPEAWQPLPTVFERAATAGVPSYAIGQGRYASSQFTRAILRGAEYVTAETVDDRFHAAVDLLAAPGGALVYLYVPELDQIAHEQGWESDAWAAALEVLDANVRALEAALGPRDGMLVSADHGIVDVPLHAHVLFDENPSLTAGVDAIGGEPRLLQLYLRSGASADEAGALAARWRAAEGARAWIATKAEAIAAGWFGPVSPLVEPRLGDVFVAARARVAYYDSRTARPQSLAMIGQHGSFSPDEVRVPLLPFGVF